MTAAGFGVRNAAGGVGAPSGVRWRPARPLAALAAVGVHGLAAAALLWGGAAPVPHPAAQPPLTLLSLARPAAPRPTSRPPAPAAAPAPFSPQPAPLPPAPTMAQPRPSPWLASLPFPVPGSVAPHTPEPIATPSASLAPALPPKATRPSDTPRPQTPPQPPATEKAAEKAAEAATGTEAPSAPASLVRAYAQRLWQHIVAHRPAGLHLEGTSLILIRLDRQGAVRAIRLKQSSGAPLLDTLALRSVKRAAPLPPPPAALSDDQLTFVIPFGFR